MTWSEFLMKWGVPIGISIIQFGVSWFMWTLRKEFVTHGKCEKRRGFIQTDIEVQKDALAKMPTAEDVKTFGEKLDKVSSGLENLKGEFTGVNRLTNLMTEYLMKKGDK